MVHTPANYSMKSSTKKENQKDKEEEILKKILINRENQTSALKKILKKIKNQKQ